MAYPIYMHPARNGPRYRKTAPGERKASMTWQSRPHRLFRLETIYSAYYFRRLVAGTHSSRHNGQHRRISVFLARIDNSFLIADNIPSSVGFSFTGGQQSRSAHERRGCRDRRKNETNANAYYRHDSARGIYIKFGDNAIRFMSSRMTRRTVAEASTGSRTRIFKTL